jgi:predicted dehydrogenase
MHRTHRGAIVGFGFIAEKGHLPAYRAAYGAAERATSRSRFEIEAVADSSPARRGLAAQLLPGVRIYADAMELLEAERGRIDFIDICAPPSEHAPLARTALESGLHVLCEKPLTTTTADAEMLLETARQTKRVLFPSHNYRHAPVVRAVRALLDEDAIGPVHLVTLQTFRTTHARGVGDWRPDWRREHRYAGGGIAMDHGSHTFYLAFDWLAAYPTALSATMTTSDGHDTEDTISCQVRFPGGATAIASLTWRAGLRRVSYTLHGERGAIMVHDDDIEVVRQRDGKSVTEKQSVKSDWMDASHVEWFGSMFDRFSDAIEKREFVGRDATDALECVRLIQAAYDSAHKDGREIVLSRAARAAKSPLRVVG